MKKVKCTDCAQRLPEDELYRCHMCKDWFCINCTVQNDMDGQTYCLLCNSDCGPIEDTDEDEDE